MTVAYVTVKVNGGADDEVEYQADEIEKLVGFIPTKDECYYSLGTRKLMDSLLRFDEEDYQTSRVAKRLDEISGDFPEIAFDEPRLVYMSIEFFRRDEILSGISI